MYNTDEKGSGLIVRNFVSEEELTDAKIRAIINESVEHKDSVICLRIIDTPEPEEVRPRVIVYLAQGGRSLYLGCKKDSEWSLFWAVDADMSLKSIMGLLVGIQKWGNMDRNTDEHAFWGGEREDLTTIAVHDGEELILYRRKMNYQTKIRLGL